MFDIGWTELLVIGIVSLIVVGPKDLPGMFRALGRFTGKARAMARDFQRAMNRAADEAGAGDLRDIGNTIRKVADPKKLGADVLGNAAKDWAAPADGENRTQGPQTADMTAERAETARKIQEATAAKASERLKAERDAVASETAGASEAMAEDSDK